MTADDIVSEIRGFNRVVTERVGALEDRYLGRDRPLGVDRILWEIGAHGIEVRALRARLGLDSGYLSRQLRLLEAQGLVVVTVDAEDARVRRAELTRRGTAEVAILDRLSDELVGALLEPLSPRQREQLAQAAGTVRRLFAASAAVIEAVDPGSPDARRAVSAYVRTLDERFDGGFSPERSLPAAEGSFRAPDGCFFVARAHGAPVGCVGVAFETEGGATIRRLWVAPEMRGAGLGRRLVSAAEEAARAAGAHRIRLETNRTLTEAIALYRRAGYVEVAPFNDEPYAHHWFQKDFRDGADLTRLGFIGLGIMGMPIARRLAGAGEALTVWNRTPRSDEILGAGDVRVAASVEQVFAECSTVFVMLRDEPAVDAVLRAGSDAVVHDVRDRTVVNLGTLSPVASERLAHEIARAGGRYVEAPVSGSRVPAEQGRLVAMLAGEPDAVAGVRALLGPVCAQTTVCGAVPGALTMKLSVNVFLIAVVTGLAEAFHFADRHGLDLDALREILDAGQMSSPISRLKTAKLRAEDLSPQAAIADVRMNAGLIVDAAAAAGAHVPLLAVCEAL